MRDHNKERGRKEKETIVYGYVARSKVGQSEKRRKGGIMREGCNMVILASISL